MLIMGHGNRGTCCQADEDMTPRDVTVSQTLCAGSDALRMPLRALILGFLPLGLAGGRRLIGP